MPSPKRNMTLVAVLEEFLRIFEGKGFFDESDGSFLHAVRQHLNGTAAPNPGGFLVDIPPYINQYLNVQRLHEAVNNLEKSGIKLKNVDMPEPIKNLLTEAVFLVDCNNLKKNIPGAFRSLF